MIFLPRPLDEPDPVLLFFTRFKAYTGVSVKLFYGSHDDSLGTIWKGSLQNLNDFYPIHYGWRSTDQLSSLMVRNSKKWKLKDWSTSCQVWYFKSIKLCYVRARICWDIFCIFRDMFGYVRGMLDYVLRLCLAKFGMCSNTLVMRLAMFGLCSARFGLRLCPRFCSDCTLEKFCSFLTHLYLHRAGDILYGTTRVFQSFCLFLIAFLFMTSPFPGPSASPSSRWSTWRLSSSDNTMSAS